MVDVLSILRGGAELFWPALGCWSVALGLLLRRRAARRQRDRSIAAARDAMGAPSTRALEAELGGDSIVLEGTLDGELCQEISRGGGTLPAARRGRFALTRDGESIALQGEAFILAGTYERFRPSGLGVRPIERRLTSGDRVLVKGRLVERSRVDGEERIHYRTTPRRRFAIVPAEQADGIFVAAQERRGKVASTYSLGATALVIMMTALVSFGAVYALGAALRRNAWSLALSSDGDLAKARRAERWAAACAIVPPHRASCLEAMMIAFDVSDARDLEAQREFVIEAARVERLQTGTCARTLEWTSAKRADLVTLEAAAACGDGASKMVAARTHFHRAEFDRAADLLEALHVREADRPSQDVALEVRTYLLAGRNGHAALSMRAAATRVGEIVEDHQRRLTVRAALYCGADALDARMGDSVARDRLERAAFSNELSDEPHAACAMLLVDLFEGSERAEVLTRVRRSWYRAAPSRLRAMAFEALVALKPLMSDFGALSPDVPIRTPFLIDDLDVVGWRMLLDQRDRHDLTPDERVTRLYLGRELVGAAALFGAPEAASVTSLLIEDARSLRDLAAGSSSEAVRQVDVEIERLRALSEYINIGRGGVTPSGEPIVEQLDPADHRALRRLLSYLQGDSASIEVDELRSLMWLGLEVAARGSGRDLVAWLSLHHEVALPVALLGAGRVKTERSEVLDWLRRVTEVRKGSLYARAAVTNTAAFIAQRLGDAALAAEYTGLAARLRTALLRRETSLIINLVDAWR